MTWVFKIRFKKTGILKEISERKGYTKPTTKRRLAKEKEILKKKYKENNDQ